MYFYYLGSAFDFHYLISGKLCDDRITYLSALPHTEERLRTLKINNYCIKDSIAFLKNSLDSLVEDMKKRNPNHPFKILRQSNLCLTNAKFDEGKFQLLQKGKSKIPYDRLTYEYLFKTRNSPAPKSHYYSALKDSHIDDETYIPTLNNSRQNSAAVAWPTIQVTMYLLTLSSLGNIKTNLFL